MIVKLKNDEIERIANNLLAQYGLTLVDKADGCKGRYYIRRYIPNTNEKFGGLRFYYSYKGDRVEEIKSLISDAEDRSFKICEVTGESGELCTKGKGYGWLKTLSDGEAGLQGYKILKEEE
jgi:hypothetical protein